MMKFKTFGLVASNKGLLQFTHSHSLPSTTLLRASHSFSSKAHHDQYTLKYFNFRVLGEPIRWQFALAGVPFKDKRYPRDKWDKEFKYHTGWGVLPILVINGNTSITQSTSISRYLARQYGLMPDDPMLQTRCDELVDNLMDLKELWRKWFRESDAENKSALEQKLREVHFPFYLNNVENFIKEFGNAGYAVGDRMTWADLYLANYTQIYSELHGEDLIVNPYPLIKGNMDKILNMPQIKKWNENRPVTKV